MKRCNEIEGANHRDSQGNLIRKVTLTGLSTSVENFRKRLKNVEEVSSNHPLCK